ncbi:hypothetical protein AQJ23_45160 [Streptomyces antibioticus]|nr:hypothetical protein [Streptomyces antibioticus]KUN16468.1 hypothetical protein AQJ23_45160 [Streptomyces antibioticus]
MEIKPGVRVSGEIKGQEFMGRVCTTGSRNGRLESVVVRTDEPLTTPAGRQVWGAHVTGDALKSLVVL